MFIHDLCTDWIWGRQRERLHTGPPLQSTRMGGGAYPREGKICWDQFQDEVAIQDNGELCE